MRTINGKRMSEHVHAKRVAEIVRKSVPGYPMCEYDWTEVRYGYNCGRSPQVVASGIIDRRSGQLASTSSTPIKWWIDEFDGEFRCNADAPSAAAAIIRNSVGNGCTHGTITLWEPVFQAYRPTGDLQPARYKWEQLR